jgi:hypothetical protein
LDLHIAVDRHALAGDRADVDGSLLGSLKADAIPLGLSGAIWETI